jgi:hypothetical protein
MQIEPQLQPQPKTILTRKRRSRKNTKRSRFYITTLVPCKCGCGLFRKPFDVNGERRYYIRWHPVKFSLDARKKMHLRKLGKHLSKQHRAAISHGSRTKRYFWSEDRMKNEVYSSK